MVNVKSGYTYIELIVAMVVSIVLFAAIAVITYNLTEKAQIITQRLHAISTINFTNFRILQNLQKAGPEPSYFQTVNGSSIRYEVIVPFSNIGHITEQLTVDSSNVRVYEKTFSGNDFNAGVTPDFTYSSKIPFLGEVSVNFGNLSLGRLNYDMHVKAPMHDVDYSSDISMINIK